MTDTTSPLFWQRAVRWLLTPGGDCLHGWLPSARNPRIANSGCGLRLPFRSLRPPQDDPEDTARTPYCKKCTGTAA